MLDKLNVSLPLQPTYQTQGFGENKACIDPNTRRIIGSRAGVCNHPYVHFYQEMGLKGHNGIDYKCYTGQPLYFSAQCTGVQWKATRHKDPDGGLGIDVISSRPLKLAEDIEEFVKFRFWHLDSYSVEHDQPTTAGMLLGRGGTTGASSGPHLHWGFKFCEENGEGKNKENGYYGAIDLTRADLNINFEPVFVFDVLGTYLSQDLRKQDYLKHMFLGAESFVRNLG